MCANPKSFAEVSRREAKHGLLWNYDAGEWWAVSRVRRKGNLWRIRVIEHGIDRGMFTLTCDIDGLLENPANGPDLIDAMAHAQAIENKRCRLRVKLQPQHSSGMRGAWRLIVDDITQAGPGEGGSIDVEGKDDLESAYLAALNQVAYLKQALLMRDSRHSLC